MTSIAVSSIVIYPLKSGQGIRQTEAETDSSGLSGDRRWMLIDEQSRFITARTCPELLRIEAGIKSGKVVFKRKGMPELKIDLETTSDKRASTKIWSDNASPLLVSSEADDWFTEAIGRECRLVRGQGAGRASQDNRLGTPSESFADNAPLMVISEESLEDLQRRLDMRFGINELIARLRPNLVVSGAGRPYAEDEWNTITLEQTVLGRVALCSRCTLTTICPDTLQRGAEPLKTLRTYRSSNGQCFFGAHYQVITPGAITLTSNARADN